MRAPSLAAHRRIAFRLATTTAVVAAFATGIVGTPRRPEQPKVQIHRVKLADAAVHAGYEKTVSPGPLQMVGFTWTGGAPATIEARGLRQGQWTDWVTVQGDPNEGPDGDSPEHHDQVSSAPAWLGRDIDQVDVRVVEGDPVGLQIHAIDTGSPTSSGTALGPDVADALVPQPGIITRAEWGADEADSYTNPGCESGVQYAPGGVTNAFIHHTVNSNDYAPSDSAALVRGIQAYHIFSNGWCDIGYNFLVDRYGQIFEGRRGGMNKAVIGGHTSGFNTGSTGVALIGNFAIAPVPTATYNALVTLLVWKFAYHGVDPNGSLDYTVHDNTGAFWPAGTVVNIQTIEGHRDVNQTECPGIYAEDLLARLRSDVAVGIASQPHEQRLVCDWNGDGVDTPAYFLNGWWYIRDSNSEGAPTQVFAYGSPGDIPVCGHWLAPGGPDTVGVYRDGVWMLRLTNTPGNADIVFRYGAPGDIPIPGDWNGDGVDTATVFRNATWYLSNVNGNVFSSSSIVYGDATDLPVKGDWTHKNADSVGVFRGGMWYLSNSVSSGFADLVFSYGNPTDTPVPGDYNNDGYDSSGIARGSYWWFTNQNATNATIVFPY